MDMNMSQISHDGERDDETSNVTADTGNDSEETAESGTTAVEIDLGEGSEGEGYVEIEHVEDTPPGIGANYTTHSPTIRHITKRTIINFAQRSVLEDYFCKGMASASVQLHPFHLAAAEKTGLDIHVVKVSFIDTYLWFVSAWVIFCGQFGLTLKSHEGNWLPTKINFHYSPAP